MEFGRRLFLAFLTIGGGQLCSYGWNVKKTEKSFKNLAKIETRYTFA